MPPRSGRRRHIEEARQLFLDSVALCVDPTFKL
jgi:hypothetical protein